MRRQRTLVIGSNGQLGTDLVDILRGRPDHTPIALTHEEIEVTDRASIDRALAKHGPDVVVNTSAYHVVDREEDAESFFRVNALGVQLLALACRDRRVPLVHFSTDYVFSGETNRPYRESDCPNPVNTYGTSKLAGELLVRAVHDQHFVVRVAGLYGVAGCRAKQGKNFVEVILQQAEQGQPIRVVNDQIMSPTYTRDVAERLLELIPTQRYGLYHMANSGTCTWFEFAREILKHAGRLNDVPLVPVSSRDFYSTVRRPKYSALDNEQLRAVGLRDLRPWPEALQAYLTERRARRTTVHA